MTEKCPGSGSWFGVLLWHRFSLWPSASLLPRLCFSVSMCPALSEERLLPTLVPCTTMCWSFHTEPSEVSSSVHAVPDASESSQLQLLGWGLPACQLCQHCGTNWSFPVGCNSLLLQRNGALVSDLPSSEREGFLFLPTAWGKVNTGNK